MPRYIHKLKDWPKFRWSDEKLSTSLAAVRHHQGRLIGRMEGLGFKLRAEAILPSLTEEIIKSSEIEGEQLDRDQVRSSIARRFGMDRGGLAPVDRSIEGVVDMMIDATQKFDLPLDDNRLFGWHSALFPTGRSGLNKIEVGSWRDDKDGPMQVTSGYVGRERVHYEAPAASRLEDEMRTFLDWFNTKSSLDPVIEAAIAHLWFVTIHPFDDRNGRIARAIADMALARSERTPWRFYSMSTQIRAERNGYYDILEATQKGDLDITAWLDWFLGCLDRAFDSAEITLQSVLTKAQFWEENVAAELNDRQRSIVSRLLDGFKGKLTSSKYATLTNCSQDTALRDIDDLIGQGILLKDAGGGRSTSYSLAEPEKLAFPDKEHRTDATRGTIFWGEEGEKRVRCIISREALDDHFSEGGRLPPDTAFQEHQAEIEALANRKYALGQLEPDGNIIIRTGEVGAARRPRMTRQETSD
jgi:Fic family protein